MKITAFDRKSCREVGDAIEEALKSVGEKFGVSIRRKSGTYSPSNYTLKLEASVVGENGLAISKEAEDFKRFATSYGLKPTDLGRKITNWSGREYQITGFRRKAQSILFS